MLSIVSRDTVCNACSLSRPQEHQVKDGIALEFLLDLLVTLKAEKGGTAVVNVIKKSGVESRLLEFFPGTNQVSDEAKYSWLYLFLK